MFSAWVCVEFIKRNIIWICAWKYHSITIIVDLLNSAGLPLKFGVDVKSACLVFITNNITDFKIGGFKMFQFSTFTFLAVQTPHQKSRVHHKAG